MKEWGKERPSQAGMITLIVIHHLCIICFKGFLSFYTIYIATHNSSFVGWTILLTGESEAQRTKAKHTKLLCLDVFTLGLPLVR